jgi:hypothetical protein
MSVTSTEMTFGLPLSMLGMLQELFSGTHTERICGIRLVKPEGPLYSRLILHPCDSWYQAVFVWDFFHLRVEWQ